MTTYRALWVTEEPQFKQQVIRRDLDQLPANEVLVRVHYSSLNYKDALSATGNRGVTRVFPHTPGIDAAGVVENSSVEGFAPGDEVIVTGYDLGMNTYGGLADYIKVPASWLIKRPAGLSLREAMILGTAGFTAGLCVQKLVDAGVKPEDGDILVTGATGGVGSVAVKLLSQLGYRVVAATGKQEQIPFLQELGAAEVMDRAGLNEGVDRPMLKTRWAGAVDTVGGEMLFNVVKSLNYGGSVACCGLTAGTNFTGNVFPFILRGASLLGVDSVELPLAAKAAMWDMLSAQWKMDLEALVEEISLEDTPQAIAKILAGHQKGRVLVNVIG